MIRKAILAAALLSAPCTAYANSTTSCHRTVTGDMDCTTRESSAAASEAAMQDGIGSLANALVARGARKRAEKARQEALAAVQPVVPFADLTTGNTFLAGCSPEPRSAINMGLCYGYLDGFFQREFLPDRPSPICLPANVSKRQLLDLLNTYIIAHPEERHNITGLLAAKAYAAVFACSPPPQAPAP